MAKITAPSGEAALNNRDATTGPGVDADDSLGYSVGSEWTDIINDKVYACVDSTTGAAVWIELTAGATGGEANTGVNVGAAGIGLFKQKAGTDLQFKNINAGSGVITLTDDVANNEVDIDVNLSNITAVGTLTSGNVDKAVSKLVQLTCFNTTQAIVVGDGVAYLRIPSLLHNFNLIAIAAQVITTGTTGTTDIQLYNVTGATNMLSTPITIDSGEFDSITAAIPAVIDIAWDDVQTADQLRIDIDVVSSTPPQGLMVELTFRTP